MRFDRGRFDRDGVDRLGESSSVIIIDTVTIYSIPLNPSAELSIFDTGLPALCREVVISQKLGDRMARATFEFAGKTTGGTASTLYYKNFIVSLPDHTGASQKVFAGFFPSSRSQYSPEKDSETMTAYSNEYYLTMQYLSKAQMSLLTPAQQQANTTWRLYLNDMDTFLFNVGQYVKGQTSESVALITAIKAYGYQYIEVVNPTGTFINGENLLVGTSVYGIMDGDPVNVTGSVVVVYPDDWVRDLLGGDNSRTKTGIRPYRFGNTATIWNSAFAVPFTFPYKTTKIQAIEKVARKLNYFHLVKLSTTGEPREYFIDEDDIDSPTEGLDLPAAVTITNPSPYLAEPVTLNINEDDTQYNRFIIRGQKFDTGEWLETVLPEDEPEKPIEYLETDNVFVNQAECDDRAETVQTYYQNQIRSWTAIFTARTDFRYLQKLIFSGYSTDIPNGTYRIVGIQYRYGDQGTINEVTCTLIANSQFKAYLQFNRVSLTPLKAAQALAKNELAQLQSIEAGTARSVNSETGEVVVETNFGLTTSGSDASS